MGMRINRVTVFSDAYTMVQRFHRAVRGFSSRLARRGVTVAATI